MDRNEFDKFARMQVGIIAEHSGQPYAKVAARRRAQLLDDREGGVGVRDGGSDINEKTIAL